MVPGFLLAVLGIWQEQERFVEENLFCFKLADGMLFRTLALVALVPIETGYPVPLHHFCILQKHTRLVKPERLIPDHMRQVHQPCFCPWQESATARNQVVRAGMFSTSQEPLVSSTLKLSARTEAERKEISLARSRTRSRPRDHRAQREEEEFFCGQTPEPGFCPPSSTRSRLLGQSLARRAEQLALAAGSAARASITPSSSSSSSSAPLRL